MSDIKVYDPPMCCSSGVCGPDADDELAQFAAALEWARKNGATVDRFNLGQQPGAFAQDARIKGLLESDGMECLPLVVIDGEVLSKGGYPSRSLLADKLGLAATDSAASSGECGAQKEKVGASTGCCS